MVPMKVPASIVLAKAMQKPEGQWRLEAGGGKLLWQFTSVENGGCSMKAKIMLQTPYSGPPRSIPTMVKVMLSSASSNLGVQVMAKGVKGTTTSVNVTTSTEVKASIHVAAAAAAASK